MWYLATNEINVFNYGEISDNAVVTTGQPKLDYFDLKEDLVEALTSYGQIYVNSEEFDLPIAPEE